MMNLYRYKSINGGIMYRNELTLFNTQQIAYRALSSYILVNVGSLKVLLLGEIRLAVKENDIDIIVILN